MGRTEKRNPSSTTIASLSNELLAEIVQLSCSPVTWDTFRVRYSHLRALALVCRALRPIAQRELFRHVVLLSVETAKLFVSVLKTRDGAEWANMARSLRVGTIRNLRTTRRARINEVFREIDVEMFCLPWITAKCRCLEDMWLVKVGPVDMEQLASGPVLKALHCYSCSIGTSLLHQKRTPPQLTLTSLSLSHCRISSYIRAKSLPHLQALVYTARTADPDESVRVPLRLLAGQLSSLRVDQITTEYLLPHAHLLTRLELLDRSFKWTTEPLHFLRNLPVQLRFLRLRPNRVGGPTTNPRLASRDDAIGTLRNLLHHQALKKLEHLRLPKFYTSFSCELRKTLDAENLLECIISYDDENSCHDADVYYNEYPYEDPDEDPDEEEGENEDENEHRAWELLSLDIKFRPDFWAFVRDVTWEVENL
ncbi:hypothetical protein P7C70_g2487, partial [Phenoliferia sp. Uapishka_3]